jgi:hypothetical protein
MMLKTKTKTKFFIGLINQFIPVPRMARDGRKIRDF